MNGRRLLCAALAAAVIPWGIPWGASLRRAIADEPSGLGAVAVIESALEKAIAAAEKSVVAIARVSDEAPLLETRVNPFGQAELLQRPTPGQPDFVPNEYGAGVVVGANGLILTAYHVLREGSSYYVTTSDRRVYRATVLAGDPRGDLAVLKIDARDLPAIRFGDSSKLKKGQIVIALGNPYAIARDGQASASWGIISNLARKDGATPNEKTPRRPTLHQYGTLIQTDAKLNLGTSGGALVNLSGEMVGLTVALSATLGYEQSAGYAIPVDDTFKRVVEQLKKGQEAEYAFLGVGPDNLTKDDRSHGKHGVLITTVVKGTPAANAGLTSGDVITQVGGHDIFDADEFMLQVGSLPAASRAVFSVLRLNQEFTREIQLAKFAVAGEKYLTSLPPQWRGIRVDFVTASKNFSLPTMQDRLDPRGSVLVTDVEADSPAWKQGVRPEMTISEVGAKLVSTPAAFHAAVANLNGQVSLRLIAPNGERITCNVDP